MLRPAPDLPAPDLPTPDLSAPVLPAPDPSARVRAAFPPSSAPPLRLAGRAGAPLPPRRAVLPDRGRAMRVVVAGLVFSALGHAVLAFWLVRASAVPPPDGPEVAATEVLILSGAQFAALTAPAPQAPEPAPEAPRPSLQDAASVVVPSNVTPPLPVSSNPAAAAPARDLRPDVAALAFVPPAPEVSARLSELVSPVIDETGVLVAPLKPPPAAKAAPGMPGRPDSADARPVAPEPPPSRDEPPRARKPDSTSGTGAPKPASVAGDGGRSETTQRATQGSAGARAEWLAAIRARVERRKTYPAAAGAAEGRVTLQLTVDRAGRLTALGIVRSSGNAVLDAAALRAVKAAGRFPKAPAAVAEASVTFNLPLRYSAGQ